MSRLPSSALGHRPPRAFRLIVVLLLGVALPLAGAVPRPLRAQTPDYQNESLPFEARARDLVRRMTLEEKVSQMQDVAPAIERLGIPAYNWWNEALHGVARSGLATVFPQAIGIAATWDDSLVFRMASVISDEARAKYQQYLREGSRERYQGLTFWSPNINLFRDPRWGRGQETYGEDPFLTGRLAVQFIRGMQGNDPHYLKTVSTVKHFAVHSGPEPARHSFDAEVSERDLRESYLPHFEAGIREGGAYSLMCAYNRVDGKPACGNDVLLQQILRGEWGFRGYVVSDCGAIDAIYLRHKVVPTAAAAAALAVRTGTDLECGGVYEHLVEAVQQGLVSEAQIDTSVTRLFLARFRLGMFDVPDHVRWAQIPFSDLDSPAHRALARQVARESIVLLRNQRGTLPLRKNLRRIAVIGPNADQWRMLLGNYNGLPADPVTPLRGVREAVARGTRVLYARGADLADGFPVLDALPSTVFTTPDGRRGLHVEYFSGQTMQGAGAPLFTGTDTVLDADWHAGAPRGDMNPDDFSVRWTGSFRPPVSGTYHLGLSGTMKFQLYLDDTLLVRSAYAEHDDEFPDPRLVQANPLTLQAGQAYRLRIEARETYGEAKLQLVWSPPPQVLEADAVKAARQAEAVVVCLGLTSRLEGEEMPVQIDGFLGGDRTSIDLPAPQRELLQRIVAVGKPTVLVLLNGSALAVNWAQAHVPAIVEAWYPGQAAGRAIADVLFGDYNPGGRLPVTFYKSVNDLPPFDDYAMAGRTYRFFAGTPLYPFGYGLSYTSFRYAHLRPSAPALAAGDSITVQVDVTNTGRRTGDEVVQLYAHHLGSAVSRAIEQLVAYRRVTLRPGETRRVRLRLAASQLAYWNAAGHGWVVESEPVELRVGGSSADIRLRKTVRLLGGR
ncbi:MAG TPA: glycoside hydrolase family 3 C-terminal domain-containing protein [Gemmatimonadaceae bacterium]|nr:glycoside hydrolase family 3 C-terminal domain-containing protein [Gemmatimonadaceae bacterium]